MSVWPLRAGSGISGQHVTGFNSDSVTLHLLDALKTEGNLCSFLPLTRILSSWTGIFDFSLNDYISIPGKGKSVVFSPTSRLSLGLKTLLTETSLGLYSGG